MGFFSNASREAEISLNEERLARLGKHGLGNTDAARTARSDIRWQRRQLAEQAEEEAGNEGSSFWRW